MQFRDWFFDQFPEDVHTNDVNKDAQDSGTFERYLRGYGMELDEEIMPYLENWMDMIDVLKTDDKYLPLVAYILGSPPYPGDNPTYRKLLAYSIAIYKVKGTKRAYEIFMNLLGLKIQIIEEVPQQKITYDMPEVIYDAEPTVYHYDTFCADCSGYWIAYSSANNTYNPLIYHVVPPETLAKVLNILCFLQPINAQFKGLVRQVSLEESAGVNITATALNGLNPLFGTTGDVFISEDGSITFKPE